MHSYRVGEMYTDRKSWPELAQYNYRGGEHELVLFLKKPSAKEIRAIRNEPADFALFVERRLIILLYQFGSGGSGIPWSDAPYSIHLVPTEQRMAPPKTDPNEQALLHVVLVDASTGIIHALRVISMPPDFTQALHKAIQDQENIPFTRASYNGELESLYRDYASTELAQMAGVSFRSSPLG